MDRKLKRWELALMFGVLCALVLGGWLEQEQTELAERVIRFHVIANSDSPEDQALKLAVRDRVLEQAEALYPEGATLEEAQAVLEEHLGLLAAAGQAVVTEEGANYPVTAQLTQCWFPTKEYEGFSLPAGEYTALRVVIGAGEGQNWWCVAFPPLCLGAASETVDEAVQAGYFTEDQARLVTEAGEGYVLKFKGMELLGECGALLRGWTRR
jgi:stage II sporulation protein R